MENNIHAGVKYLRHLMDTYLDDDAIDPVERQLLALAAYNAGPGRIRQLRRKAVAAGLDPDVAPPMTEFKDDDSEEFIL